MSTSFSGGLLPASGRPCGPEPEALSPRLDDVGVEGEPVDDGGHQSGVRDDRAPLAEGQVAAGGDGCLLLPLGHDLKQQLGPPSVELHVAKLVEAEQVESSIAGHDAGQAPLVGCLHQLVDQLGAGHVADSPALLTGGDAEADEQVALARAAVTEEDDGVAGVEVGAVGQRGDGGRVDRRRRRQVEVGQALHAGEASLVDPPLLVGAVGPGDAEEAVKGVVGAQSHEALRLDAVPALEHPGHGRLQVVVADAERGHPAEVLEGAHVAVEEGLLGLVQVDAVEPPARGRQPHDEHPALGEQAVEIEADAPEVDLRLLAQRMVLGHHHLPQHHGLSPAGLGHVAAHRRLAHVGAVLVDQALPDSPGRVALLLGDVAVLRQPGVDRRLPRLQHWRHSRRGLAWRRHGRRQGLAHRSPMHVELLGQRPH